MQVMSVIRLRTVTSCVSLSRPSAAVRGNNGHRYSTVSRNNLNATTASNVLHNRDWNHVGCYRSHSTNRSFLAEGEGLSPSASTDSKSGE